MSPEDIRKMLGGYAAGTLTEAEQQALFAAALEDQELFDALAGEQSLRDLLSDPAARAELLSALDTPRRSAGFWDWLRRPAVAGLAAAGVVTVAALAVWQGTRIPMKQAVPTIVAELRSQPPSAHPPAEIPPMAGQQGAGKGALKMPAPARMADQSVPPAAAPPPPEGMQAMVLRKDEPLAGANEKKAVPATPAPLPMQAEMARKEKAEADATAAALSVGKLSDSVNVTPAADARALFYANQPSPGANAFVPPAVSGGAPPPAPQSDAAPRAAKAIAGFAAVSPPAAQRLGVRVSILRGDSEVDFTTVLNPGEPVRLKLTPNADGFLYVVEGTRLVASGEAQRLKPFETQELRLEGSGRKQLYVMLSRSPQTVDPASLPTLARGDLVETSARQDRATYVVTGQRDAASQQVVVPVTLTWR